MSHEEIVQKTLNFLRANLGQPLTMDEVAKNMGHTSSWLGRIFRKKTGESILPFLVRFRIEKAQELLRQTGLSVTEISFEVGFQSYTHFAHAFRKNVGLSPSAYRDGARIQQGESSFFEQEERNTSGSPCWFSADFSLKEIGPWWKVLAGEWSQSNATLQGRSEFDLTMGLTKPLPENFKITFEVLFREQENFSASDLHLSFRNSAFTGIFRQFTLGYRENTTGVFARTESGMPTSILLENSEATLKPNAWQHIEIELRGDTWKLLSDEKELFTYQDPFAPPYAQRCRFALGSVGSILSVRNFRVYDLGFSTLVPVIGQGDALFQTGSFDEAREFYLRLLQSEGTTGMHAELYYKIGMCHLMRSRFAETKKWMGRVFLLPLSGAWANHAKLASLEITWKQDDWSALLHDAENLIAERGMLLSVRELLDRVCMDLAQRGFHEMAAQFHRVVAKAEVPGTFHSAFRQGSVAESLLELGRICESETWIHSALKQETKMKDWRIYKSFTLADVLALQGRFGESLEMVSQIRASTKNPLHLARCEINEALVCQGLGDMEKSAALLEGIKDLFSKAIGFVITARLLAIWPLCVLGKIEKAREMVETVQTLAPHTGHLTVGTRGRYLYTPLLCEGRFPEAGQILMEDSQIDDNRVAAHAEQAVMAGIFFELSGEKEKAGAIWTDTLKRYPPARCCFFGSLAKNLRDGIEDQLEKMPYHCQRRSEMFYLAGLLYEHRGDLPRSQTLFKLSAEEDLSRRWPSWLAKRKILHSPTK